MQFTLLTPPFIKRIIQKKKIFPVKFNFFDWFVILAILGVLIFFVYNRLQRHTTWINLRLAIKNSDVWYNGQSPQYWYMADLNVGDVAYDSFGEKTAEVMQIDNYDQGGPYRLIYVDLKIRADYDKRKHQYLYEFKPLTVGSGLLLNFNNQQVNGLVVSFADQQLSYQDKVITVRMRTVLPQFADAIKVGDKTTDSQGNVVAEILAVKSQETTYYDFSDLRGKKIQVSDPEYRDIDVKVRVKTFESLGRSYYINQSALKVGSNIWLQFPQYALENAQIIEME